MIKEEKPEPICSPKEKGQKSPKKQTENKITPTQASRHESKPVPKKEVQSPEIIKKNKSIKQSERQQSPANTSNQEGLTARPTKSKNWNNEYTVTGERAWEDNHRNPSQQQQIGKAGFAY